MNNFGIKNTYTKKVTEYFTKMHTESTTYSKHIREGAFEVGKEIGHGKGTEQTAFIHQC